MNSGERRQEGRTAKAPDLSVILPAFDEGEVIGAGLRRLREHLAGGYRDWEIVVVDDGSADRTAAIVQQAAAEDPRVRLARMDRNTGKWSAVARGVREARGSILAVTDADLSYSLEDLDAAVEAVERGAGLATGARNLDASRINLPFNLLPYLVRRWLAGAVFRNMVRLLFGLEVSDTQCGLKAFSRDAALEIVSRIGTRRFLADIEVFLVAREMGIRVAEIPVSLRYLSGASSVRMFSDLPGALADLARIKLRSARGLYGRGAVRTRRPT